MRVELEGKEGLWVIMGIPVLCTFILLVCWMALKPADREIGEIPVKVESTVYLKPSDIKEMTVPLKVVPEQPDAVRMAIVPKLQREELDLLLKTRVEGAVVPLSFQPKAVTVPLEIESKVKKFKEKVEKTEPDPEGRLIPPPKN